MYVSIKIQWYTTQKYVWRSTLVRTCYYLYAPQLIKRPTYTTWLGSTICDCAVNAITWPQGARKLTNTTNSYATQLPALPVWNSVIEFEVNSIGWWLPMINIVYFKFRWFKTVSAHQSCLHRSYGCARQWHGSVKCISGIPWVWQISSFYVQTSRSTNMSMQRWSSLCPRSAVV
jgi:hypothetical protein